MKKRLQSGITIGILCVILFSQNIDAVATDLATENTESEATTETAADTATLTDSSTSSAATSDVENQEESESSSQYTSSETQESSEENESNSTNDAGSNTENKNSDSQTNAEAGTEEETSTDKSSSEESFVEETTEYTLTFSAVIENGVLYIEGSSSDSKVTITISDSNGVQLVQKSAKVNKDSFSKNIATSEFEAGDTVDITVTDTDGNEAARSVIIPVMAQEIDVEEYEEDLTVGSTLTLSATVLPSTVTNTTITYASSNPAIATVNSAGKVTGVAAGSVTIVLPVDHITKEIPVNVYVETDSIALNSNFCTLTPGETFTIETNVSPAEALQSCTFKSTDTSVATVSESGVVTAKKKGSASILISNGHKSVVATIIVNDQSSGTTDGEEQTDAEVLSASVVSTNELVQTIQDSAEEEIIIEQEGTILLDQEVLKLLKESGKTLIIEKEEYDMRIAGSDIKNPANELDTTIDITKEDQGCLFTINDGNRLPGKISVTFKTIDKEMQKYLYLYNNAKQKYEYISTPEGKEQISIETYGQYLLTQEKQKSSPLNMTIIGSAAVICVILGIVYFFSKKKYLLW